ncbi:26S protease regulatory subunit [Salarchaeum sp. JOR-1]|uniref:ATP-binding protein n=1 Tax=Salarchaeum sp. JOR-1 TaxID=2599399 RepID=UPI001198712D|nr:ATP-binding protein [Salarchaeum sp. JOR-1]QDX39354.1 ATP-binding protein [Salarchaeum sp. JOR-1]
MSTDTQNTNTNPADDDGSLADTATTIETQIDQIEDVEQSSDLEATIQFYESLKQNLITIKDTEVATPHTDSRLEYVRDRLDDLYDVRETALNTDTDTEDDSEPSNSDESSENDPSPQTNSNTTDDSADSDTSGTFAPETPEIDFSDYIGRDDLKEDLQARVLGPYRDADRIEELGLETTSGVLLYGPPGTGKSYVARALGGEGDLSYIEVKIPDIKDRYVGGSEENIQELFATAREHAPCIICMDEVDALATSRGADNNSTGKDDMINTFLDEFEKSPRGVLVIGTTNRRDRVDEAFERGDRFETSFEVGLPERDDRIKLLKHFLTTPVDRPRNPGLRIDILANKTDGYSTSNIEQLVNEAAWDVYLNDQDRLSMENFEAAFDAISPVEYSRPGRD